MNVLIDNTTFAGTMRVLQPALKGHNRFYERYPNYRELDFMSFCDFLTGMCLYKNIKLEGGSKDIAKDFELPSDSWVSSLVMRLPSEFMSIISTGISRNYSERESIITAYNLFNSPFAEKIRLPLEEKIPDGYYSKDYVYRQEFEVLNQSHNNALSEADLVQAMFLHRGLFLQAYASTAKDTVYMPYYYRGKMLQHISPAIIMQPPSKGLSIAQLPTRGERLLITDTYQKQLNIFYLELLQKFSWTNYNVDIPFIGYAIYQSASFDANKALDLALKYRSQESFSSFWNELTAAIEGNNKLEAERILEAFKKELTSAAIYMGAKIENPNVAPVMKLLTSLLPYSSIVEPLLELLPETAKQWGRNVINNFILNTPAQSLFIQHVKSNYLGYYPQ